MGQKEKLIRRLRSKPHDFTFDEAETLLGYLGFKRSNKGATSGSRVSFASKDYGALTMHMPHPCKELKPYQIRQLISTLEGKGLI